MNKSATPEWTRYHCSTRASSAGGAGGHTFIFVVLCLIQMANGPYNLCDRSLIQQLQKNILFTPRQGSTLTMARRW